MSGLLVEGPLCYNPRAMRFVLVIIAALSVLACGGGDNGGSGGGGDAQGSLNLRGGTYTEEEFRTEIRSLLSTVDSDIICASLEGLSGRQVADALDVVTRQQGITPFQDGDPDDEARAGEILLEECNRIN
jgi:hypothetical protein